jgi:Cof subfamily protein (haloacid dehalogenase superfamily)
MGKFDGILICTDLDGTLYKNDKTISPENKKAIKYFESEGGYFTFITGRMPYYSMDAYEKAGPNVPFGCVNGGGLYDGKAQKYVWTTDMPSGFEDLIKCVDEGFENVGIQACCFDKTYFCKETDSTVTFRARTGLPKLLGDYRSIREPIGKIIFSTDNEQELLAVEQTLRSHPNADKYDFVRSEKMLFEILPKGVDKGLALGKLVEYLGIDNKKTIAVGDYNNDIGMFKAAKYGIAVSNACPDALNSADLVTVSNEESAIAKIISDIENGVISFD